ncbi:M61 family metallopeptidase [Phenylobacterium sp.]|uniref:M61 family metallopeptidase n=1 Tax=Phenylobacterium sp. TaxID=1871053 RepID=UPI00345B84AD
MPALKSAFLAAALLLAAASPVFAQPSAGPQPVALPPAVPAPRDVAYPGVIRLEVDLTDTARRIWRVKETIPVAQSGPLTLLYPQWLPGKHAPRGAIDKLAGLVIKGDGKTIPWVRDTVDVYAFHLDVPAGVREITAEFQFLTPTAPNQGRVMVTPEMLNLQWEAVALYPAGHFSRRVMVEPRIRLPGGWGYGVALDTAAREGDVVRFKPVDFETLVDSPIFAGRHFRQIDLDPGARIPVRLNVVGDTAGELVVADKVVETHRNLVRQADKLFGSRPFDRYEFLLAISDRLGGIGLEHHRSSENQVEPGYFTDFDKAVTDRNLLAHEYTHAWDGKYRRPAELWTPNYNVPMRGQLLWVYEGQDQYWGYVLGGRSGMFSKEESLEALAATAATYETRIGRRWRHMEDTGQDPVMSARRPQPWVSWQRSEEYYSEGQLIWLDADTLIRERSGGKRSLDDFARAFFGGKDGDWTVRPYTFEDVVAALNAVEPYDWATFLKVRIRDVAVKPPLDGITRGGWKLVYDETPTSYFKAAETAGKNTNLTYSLGVVLGREGEVTSVLWDSPAFDAGLTVSTRILAVDGIAYDADRLKAAITAAKDGRPISLLVRNGDHFQTIPITYRGGLRYPRLERLPGKPDLLSEIYRPR